MNKILICGLGAIGQRHLRLLRILTQGRSEIAALRNRKLNITISDTLTANANQAPEEFYNIQTFDNKEEAFEWGPDCVFVTNPISMHIETALLAAQSGAHVFIEKPLGSSRDGVAELRRILSANKLTSMVGFQQRYHPAYKQLKKNTD